MAESEVKNEMLADGDVVMEDIAQAPDKPSSPSADQEPQEHRPPDQEQDEEEQKEKLKLQDIFAEMESDEEFPSSRPARNSNENEEGDSDVSQTSSLSPPTAPGVSSGDVADMKASDPELMRIFYQRLFPWRYLFQWLNHSPIPSKDFGHREFAFTLQGDIYARYQSFPTHDLLRKDVLRLMPSRFEIGPIYSTNPRDRKTMRGTPSFKPIAKELCFDIDLTDYDDIRTCCDKANICRKCWAFMTMAIRVLDRALRDDFGFKHIMWVYSGRRGAHAWVCDRSARLMEDAKRRAVAGYLEVVKGGAHTGKKVNLWRPLHPHLVRSLDVLAPYFQEDVLAVQNPWESAEQAEKLLRLLPDVTLNDSLRRKWESAPGRSSVAKWNDIDGVAKTGASKKLDTRTLLEAKQDIVLEYTYPRLDIEVSKKLNHLLKSPFVVHPGTGRVCVPIDTRDLEIFDPLAVPTVQALIKEIDEWKGGNNSNNNNHDKEDGNGAGGVGEDAPNGNGTTSGERKPLQDWEKTSLKPYIEYFRSFVLKLMKDERDKDVRAKREREEPAPGSDAMEF